jgi:hypothetical protein
MIARLGIIMSWRIDAFLLFFTHFKTAFLVHSLPVPEVVGTAINGFGLFCIGLANNNRVSK